MKLRDFKKINESWDNWLSEGEGKKLFYRQHDFGYIGFFDESGKELDTSVGQMVLDLIKAGKERHRDG